jgi:exopolysaccharide production protein ExoY
MTFVSRELSGPAPSEATEIQPHQWEASIDGRTSAYTAGGKRALDLFALIVSAPFWLPLIAVTALAIWIVEGKAPFYSQLRVGRNGNTFRLWKLRTMVVDAEAKLEAYLAANPKARAEWDATQKLKNDPRITTLGAFLRKSSLDELPQLINVARGDMSLVGPRPMMINQRTLYGGHAYYRLRPGLTGLWQVSKRNQSQFSERVRFDNIYYRVQSLRTDLLILLKTVGVVLRGTGY